MGGAARECSASWPGSESAGFRHFPFAFSCRFTSTLLGFGFVFGPGRDLANLILSQRARLRIDESLRLNSCAIIEQLSPAAANQPMSDQMLVHSRIE
jgi:hypothetical protein